MTKDIYLKEIRIAKTYEALYLINRLAIYDPEISEEDFNKILDAFKEKTNNLEKGEAEK